MFPQVDEIVERLEDVGFEVRIMFPYVIVMNLKNRQFTSMEVAMALDIEPEFVTRSVSGDIRITCD